MDGRSTPHVRQSKAHFTFHATIRRSTKHTKLVKMTNRLTPHFKKCGRLLSQPRPQDRRPCEGLDRGWSLTSATSLLTEYRSTVDAGAAVRSTQSRKEHGGGGGGDQRYAREMSSAGGCGRCDSVGGDAALRTLAVVFSALVARQRYFSTTTNGPTAWQPINWPLEDRMQSPSLLDGPLRRYTH